MLYKEEVLQELEAAQAKYEEELRRILGRVPGARFDHITHSGLTLKPLYTPKDVENQDYFRNVSFPGQYPYTRGVFPAGYLTRSLHIRQVTGLGTAEETNQRWKFLLSQGANALSVVPDDGSGCRADSDDPRVRGLVGRGGVALDSLYDYQTLFDGIDLTRYTVHIISTSAYALACYLAVAEEKGIAQKDLRGSMSNWVRPDSECLDIIEYCSRNVPLFNSGYLDMRNVREGGCTAAQEIAFGVACALACSDDLLERGLQIDDFLHRMTWFVNAGPEFLEEIAKFRAMRRVWARVFKERYEVRDQRSLMCRMHCQTYAPTCTMQQPFNNLIRSTIYALAAVLGGVQSLHVNSFDEALAIPTEFSASLSVRTQQIIEIETGVTKVIDPLGGSYLIEYLTDKLEEEALTIIDKIKKMGGAFKVWDWMVNEVREAALKNQLEYDRNQRLLVGVNTLVDPEDIQMKALKTLQQHADFEAVHEYSPAFLDKQIERLNKVRKERDPARSSRAGSRLREAMAAGENMIPPLVEAVKVGLTRGEFAMIKGDVYQQHAEGPYVCSPPAVIA